MIKRLIITILCSMYVVPFFAQEIDYEQFIGNMMNGYDMQGRIANIEQRAAFYSHKADSLISINRSGDAMSLMTMMSFSRDDLSETKQTVQLIDKMDSLVMVDNIPEAKIIAAKLTQMREDFLLSSEVLDQIKVLIDNNELGQAEELVEDMRVRFGDDNRSYTFAISLMANAYDSFNDSRKALKYHQKAIEINKELYGAMSTQYAIQLLSMGAKYISLGNFDMSMKYYNESLEVSRELWGETSMNYYGALNAAAGIYMIKQDHHNAIKCYTKIVDLIASFFGSNNAIHGSMLNILAYLYANIGEEEKAIEMTHQALGMMSENDGVMYASTLCLTGSVYMILGDYQNAIKYTLESLKLYNQLSDENNCLVTGATLKTLALIYLQQGDYENAIKYTSQNLEVHKPLYDENKHIFTDDLSSAALIYAQAGKISQALEIYEPVIGLIREDVLQNFKFLTEQERQAYWNYRRYGIDLSYQMLISAEDKSKNYIAYDAALFSKGLILTSSSSLSSLILESGDPSVIAHYKDFVTIKNQLKDPAINPLLKDSLLNQSQKIERLLVETSESYGDYTKELSADWKRVQRSLKQTDVAIEFVSFNNINSDETKYAAIVLRKDWENPEIVEIATADQLQSHMRLEEKMYSGFASKIGYNQIWAKLEPYINQGDNIYFSPAGLIHQINIELLQNSEGRRINEVCDVYRVSSTRYIDEIVDTLDFDEATLYGGLIYDIDSMQMISQSKQFPINRSLSRSMPDNSAIRYNLDYLLGTKIEIDDIAVNMSAANIKMNIYEGKMGCEESFKSLSNKRMPIIHIATHGFFIPSNQVAKIDYYKAAILGNQLVVEDNPMARSGLIMAGAQNAWMGGQTPSGVDDGILLSEEIASLNLSGTKLIVLSACETGLGDITDEGVFGLQRAFKQAGAETIVMSLWEVSDSATTLMMQSFYQALLEGKSKYDSFKIARQKVKDEYSSPFFWAAFIILD